MKACCALSRARKYSNPFEFVIVTSSHFPVLLPVTRVAAAASGSVYHLVMGTVWRHLWINTVVSTVHFTVTYEGPFVEKSWGKDSQRSVLIACRQSRLTWLQWKGWSLALSSLQTKLRRFLCIGMLRFDLWISKKVWLPLLILCWGQISLSILRGSLSKFAGSLQVLYQSARCYPSTTGRSLGGTAPSLRGLSSFWETNSKKETTWPFPCVLYFFTCLLRLVYHLLIFHGTSIRLCGGIPLGHSGPCGVSAAFPPAVPLAMTSSEPETAQHCEFIRSTLAFLDKTFCSWPHATLHFDCSVRSVCEYSGFQWVLQGIKKRNWISSYSLIFSELSLPPLFFALITCWCCGLWQASCCSSVWGRNFLILLLVISFLIFFLYWTPGSLLIPNPATERSLPYWGKSK